MYTEIVDLTNDDTWSSSESLREDDIDALPNPAISLLSTPHSKYVV